tara:strand:- start:219 stop:818 length:600 start_codon:yes stop_codon:yes gene_type:complete
MEEEAFKAALSYAIDRGEINSDTPVGEALSGYKGINYELCDDKGKILCKIPQGIVAKKLEDKGFKSNPMTESETREKAVLWARSMGYPIPSKMGGCLAIILVIIGLCVFVVPGILILLWVWYQGNQYERDMRQLVAKWVDAGKPTPGKKQNLEKTLEIVPEKNSEEEMEQKLKDLLSMKERNVISDEEYNEMRKKILGL